MPKFRKKPVTIEAVQFDGKNDPPGVFAATKICLLTSSPFTTNDATLCREIGLSRNQTGHITTHARLMCSRLITKWNPTNDTNSAPPNQRSLPADRLGARLRPPHRDLCSLREHQPIQSASRD